MSLTFSKSSLALSLALAILYTVNTVSPNSDYGYWIEDAKPWAFNYCNVIKSSSSITNGESSQFECINGNWVTNIWQNNANCNGSPTFTHNSECNKPECICMDNDNISNHKLVEFTLYDGSCSNINNNLQYTTAAAIIDECFEYNNKGYKLHCNSNNKIITRTEYNDINCNDNTKIKTIDITPINTELYCYSFKCETDTNNNDNGTKNNVPNYIVILLIAITTILMCYQHLF